MDKTTVESVEAVRLRKAAGVEYKTLRAEIISNINIIMKIFIGSYSAIALLYAYLLSNSNVSPFAFLIPLLIIMPAYLITGAMFYVIACISAYIIVHLNDFPWEKRLHIFYEKNLELGNIDIISRFKIKYYNTILISYKISALLCLLIFLAQSAQSEVAIIIMNLIIFIVLFVIGWFLMPTKQLDEVKSKLIGNWRKID